MTTNPEQTSNAPRLRWANSSARPARSLPSPMPARTPMEFLARHVAGDWGQVCAADAAENELSVKEGFRILSAYSLRSGTRIWIITEADRSSTCVLLPEEY
jgi:hypothetical protein